MKLNLAANYSEALVDLLNDGAVAVDCLKCPAWPDTIARAQRVHPVYVHFPLRVGVGIGDAIDSETGERADWRRVEGLLARTATPVINLHLEVTRRDLPHIGPDSVDPTHVAEICDRSIRDVESVVRRFGADRVIVENNYGDGGNCLRPILLSETINAIVDATDCGFLLDLAHASIAACELGLGIREYVESLPVRRLGELHVSGIRVFDGRWIDAARAAGVDHDVIEGLAGRCVDHLPMTEDDWMITEWALKQVGHRGWRAPWTVTLEYGGVGPLFSATTDRDVLAKDVPRLRRMTQYRGADSVQSELES